METPVTVPKPGLGKPKHHPTYDLAIIGAGAAGTTLATLLGRQGLSVAVVDRDLSEQDRIVGELLQPGGVTKLQEMGLNQALKGFGAQSVVGYAVFMGERSFRVHYPEIDNVRQTGRGFRNGKFVQKLREVIAEIPSVVMIEGTVKELLKTPDESRIDGFRYRPKGAKDLIDVKAHLTVVSDGFFSIFRDQLSRNNKRVGSFFLGLVLKSPALPYPNHGHVFIATPSPFLAYPISATETRVLIDFKGEHAPRQGPDLVKHLHEVIGPQIPDSLREAFHEAVARERFKVMPNHTMAARPNLVEGAVLLGDSLNMRHPLTGGGMTVTFTDAHNLGTKLLQGADFSNRLKIHDAVKDFYNSRHRQNATINILADALYKIICHPDLSTACFEYLSRGEIYAATPVSILAAVSRRRNLLIWHFFRIAWYGARKVLKPFPTWGRIQRSYSMMRDAVHIIDPLIKNERPGLGMRTALSISRIIFR